MEQSVTDSPPVSLVANTIMDTFQSYHSEFKSITRRALVRFKDRSWSKGQQDSAERLDLYKTHVDQAVTTVKNLLGELVHDKTAWIAIKQIYAGLLSGRDDWELAETFFNSITRRIFITIGLDPQMEFIDGDFEATPSRQLDDLLFLIEGYSSSEELIEKILNAFCFPIEYKNQPQDIQLAARVVDRQVEETGIHWPGQQIEMVKAVFYRNKGAYLVGRICSENGCIPLVLALLNTPEGLMVDAVLMKEDDLNILFSFTRSYFHIEVDCPYQLVRFLTSIMPGKHIAELYTAIGYNKHGKTMFYRDLMHHLDHSADLFEIARGDRGMVMTVFTLPSYNVVFKIIKDYFAPPKETSRAAVIEQYQSVFKHDRAGRLVDAQEFEHLKFNLKRIAPDLLKELLEVASGTVEIEGDYLVVKHAYVERRLTPLNVYIREASVAETVAAVIEYGNAVKDLASNNIFPGDMFLKNFGVTRHGRVVFYDYDELCPLVSCNFRKIPEPTNFNDELMDQPWYPVGSNDIFPEEFEYFCGLKGKLLAVFKLYHGDIFDLAFWKQTQDRLRTGEVIDIFPYDQNKRLHYKNSDWN